jgi:hypothetical protein
MGCGASSNACGHANTDFSTYEYQTLCNLCAANAVLLERNVLAKLRNLLEEDPCAPSVPWGDLYEGCDLKSPMVRAVHERLKEHSGSYSTKVC